MKTPVTFLLSLTSIFVFGIFNIKIVFAIDKCTTVEKKINNQIDMVFKNIIPFENCIKPASKYRLKSCIKRKQEGSKGSSCLPELSKSISSNKNKDCEVRFNEIKRSLQNLALLEEGNDSCQKNAN